MSKEQIISKGLALVRDRGIDGDARQLLMILAFENQCHQRRTRFHYSHAKLPGHAVAEIRGADLCERKAPTSDNEGSGKEFSAVRCQNEPRAFRIRMVWRQTSHIFHRTLCPKLNDCVC